MGPARITSTIIVLLSLIRPGDDRYGKNIQIEYDFLNRRRGSLNIIAFKLYIGEWKKEKHKGLDYDRVIVVHDCKCKGKEKVKKFFSDIAGRSAYPYKEISYALPDPYIERWYLADTKALKEAIKLKKEPSKLGYVHDKKRPDFYKNEINRITSESEMELPWVASEYGDKIAEKLDLQAVGKVDKNFKEFIESL